MNSFDVCIAPVLSYEQSIYMNTVNFALPTKSRTDNSNNPTNKTQVFNEISIMENWLIIHLINSRTFLMLYSW